MGLKERQILHYLKTECIGIENSITSDDLCSIFDISPRELRQVKRNIVLDTDAHVGSTEKGYWYAENDLEVMKFRNDYVKRIRKYKIMIDKYEDLVNSKDQMQLI